MRVFSTGQLADLVGVGVETLRFYERQGLLERPPRKDSGYRQYPLQAVRRLRFIKKAKEVGFSLKEIRELLRLRVEMGATCEDVRNRAHAKIEEIEQKIRALEKMRQALGELTESCRDDGPADECPILKAFEWKEQEQ